MRSSLLPNLNLSDIFTSNPQPKPTIKAADATPHHTIHIGVSNSISPFLHKMNTTTQYHTSYSNKSFPNIQSDTQHPYSTNANTHIHSCSFHKFGNRYDRYGCHYISSSSIISPSSNSLPSSSIACSCCCSINSI